MGDGAGRAAGDLDRHRRGRTPAPRGPGASHAGRRRGLQPDARRVDPDRLRRGHRGRAARRRPRPRETTLYKLMRDLRLPLGTSLGPHFGNQPPDGGPPPPRGGALSAPLPPVAAPTHEVPDLTATHLLNGR